MTDGSALYVYALVRHREAAADGVTGLDGRPPRLLRAPGTEVATLVHEASPVPFQGGAEQVRRWVGEQNAAVTTVGERTGSVLPMTFHVLVADEPPSDRPPGGRSAEQRLTSWITERVEEITERLAELAGRCGLRVEITVDRTAVEAPEPAARAGEEQPESRSAGMRRLLARQREQQAKNVAGQLADPARPDATRPAGRRRRPPRPRPRPYRAERDRGPVRRPAGTRRGHRHGRPPAERPAYPATRHPRPLSGTLASVLLHRRRRVPGDGVTSPVDTCPAPVSRPMRCAIRRVRSIVQR
jgi:hypothetical protein